MKKILQFHEATQQRMGVAVVGPSGCGKSTVWRVLKAALARLGQKIPTCVITIHCDSLSRPEDTDVRDYDSL